MKILRPHSMISDEQNILDMCQPNLYKCVVWRYRAGTSLMLLRLFKKDQEIDHTSNRYLVFTNVCYFQGPMKWEGAFAKLGSDEECVRILHNLHSFRSLSEEYLIDNFLLVNFMDVVKIVSSELILSQNCPPNFKEFD